MKRDRPASRGDIVAVEQVCQALAAAPLPAVDLATTDLPAHLAAAAAEDPTTDLLVQGKVTCMSRSKRKTPIVGNTLSESDKEYKKERAGQERARERSLIHDAKLDSEEAQDALGAEQAPWNEWATARDGKQYLKKSEWSESKVDFNKLMRK